MTSSASAEALAPGYFLPYQTSYLKDQSRFKILEKSRRIGGTYMQSFEDVTDLIRDKNLPAVYFSSADLTAAAEYIDYCAKWAKVYDVAAKNHGLVVLDDEKDIKTYMIELAGGKKIHALSSNPKAFRSKGGKLILDEFAWHEDADKMWAAARPIVTWGFPVRILSTHNGVTSRFNRFIKEVDRGKLKWSRHRIPIQRAVDEGLVDKILRRPATQAERLEWLENEHSACADESTWQQEYCCVPTDENSAFLTYEMLFAVERPDLEIDLSDVTDDLFLGFDIARRKHGSIAYVFEKRGHILYERKKLVLDKLTFREQKAILWPILAHPKLRRAAMDETGIGMQFVEEAQQAFGRFKIEAVNFSGSKVKEELAYGLYTDIEDRTMLFSVDDKARESLHSVRKITTTAGNLRFDAAATDKTGHGDYFWAAALARHAARDATNADPFIESAGATDSNADAFMQAFSNLSRGDLNGY